MNNTTTKSIVSAVALDLREALFTLIDITLHCRELIHRLRNLSWKQIGYLHLIVAGVTTLAITIQSSLWLALPMLILNESIKSLVMSLVLSGAIYLFLQHHKQTLSYVTVASHWTQLWCVIGLTTGTLALISPWLALVCPLLCGFAMYRYLLIYPELPRQQVGWFATAVGVGIFILGGGGTLVRLISSGIEV